MSYLQVRHFPIRVNVAYHSPLMAPIASKYMNAIGDMKDKTIPLCSQFKPKMISSVTGGEVNAKELRLGSYWVKNMLAPVKFLQAMNRLCQVQCKPLHKIDGSHRSILSTNTLIEIGPHSALQGPICEIISKAGADWIEYYSVLKRDRSTIDSILDTAGRLYCRGFSKLNFTSLNRPGNTSLIFPSMNSTILAITGGKVESVSNTDYMDQVGLIYWGSRPLTGCHMHPDDETSSKYRKCRGPNITK
ncbi:hypothetical protein BELL_1067g00030 [Botrytis elliptica]|uniref:Malonyl-CoA:ACP transacylase (MAT) domain-containing protein n=1 Tax=Botrytis elliptica TaxID=278938 RepID=A0A4Z1IVS4_9HELO|nr:hypothetical protein BELL_1067g00030 [Botrytis elliptica]